MVVSQVLFVLKHGGTRATPASAGLFRRNEKTVTCRQQTRQAVLLYALLLIF
jgi:hypothetical protein